MTSSPVLSRPTEHPVTGSHGDVRVVGVDLGTLSGQGGAKDGVAP